MKWPNDVSIAGRKVTSVLVEWPPGAEGWAVIGVGLNVDVPHDAFPSELRDTATSLTAAPAGKPEPAVAGPELQFIGEISVGAALLLLNHALEDLGGRLRKEASSRGRPPARALIQGGRRISWDGGAGTAAEWADSGHLLVDSERG